MKLSTPSYLTILVSVFVIASLLMGGLVLAQDAEPEHPHWTYEGEEGPSHWGELNPDYELCSLGEAQSPINIVDAQTLNLTDIAFDYAASALNIFNNGHTIQVQYDEGSSIVYNEIQYNLIQFHFHTPSEHTVNGESFEMELHFVHQDANGSLAVVGVLLHEGAENEAYAELFEHLPATEGEPEPTELSIEAAGLLPEETSYYTYGGSLTTPPCSQGVRWLVLTTPVEISAEQIETFRAIFEMNARPVQPLNERDLLQDSGANG